MKSKYSVWEYKQNNSKFNKDNKIEKYIHNIHILVYYGK